MSHSTYSREIYLESLKNELVCVVLITQHESKEKYAEDIMALSNSPQRLRPELNLSHIVSNRTSIR